MIKTTNKDLSCKVMEAGIVLDTEFFHVRIRVEDEHRYGSLPHKHHYVWRQKHKVEINFDTAVEVVPSPTSDELLEVMQKLGLEICMEVLHDIFDVTVLEILPKGGAYRHMKADTLADALAKLAIWLVEQGLWVKH